MDKLQMAHGYAVKLLEHGNMTPEEIIETSWFIADAMQSEADKRAVKGVPLELEERMAQETADLWKKQELEWQPDWSQAPDDAMAWEYLGYGAARWHTTKKGFFKEAPTFDQPYYGSMVLRKRPK